MITIRIAISVLMAGLLGSQARAGALDEHLAGLWHFNEDSGQTATDSSPNKMSGTINGATWTEGKYGKALEFNAVKQTFVEIPNHNLLNPSNITLSAWIKPAKFGQHGDLIICKKRDGKAPGYKLMSFYRMVLFEIGVANNTVTYKILTEKLLEPDNWYWIVATYDGKTMKVFVNGEEAATGQASDGIASNKESLIIGNFQGGKAPYAFDGIIDEVIILNMAVPKENILELTKYSAIN